MQVAVLPCCCDAEMGTRSERFGFG